MSKPDILKEIREHLQNNPSALECPNCKHRLGSLAKFCNQCGTAMPEPAIPIDPRELAEHTQFQCNKLGHLLQQGLVDAKFCSSCGTKLKLG